MKMVFSTFTALLMTFFLAIPVFATDDGFDDDFDEPTTIPSTTFDYEGLWIDFAGGAAAGTEGFAAGMDKDGNPAGLSSVLGQSTAVVFGSVQDDSCGECEENQSRFKVEAEGIQQSLNVIEDADGVAANATQSNAAILGTIDFTRYREESTGTDAGDSGQ